jgi:hypothetical protein
MPAPGSPAWRERKFSGSRLGYRGRRSMISQQRISLALGLRQPIYLLVNPTALIVELSLFPGDSQRSSIMTGIRLHRPFSPLVFRSYIFLALVAIAGKAAQSQINFHKPDFDTGKRPVAVAAADFNRDGHLDVVTANEKDSSISVLLNDGKGGFLGRTDYPVGNSPQAVLAADFNNDGVPDVAVANRGANTVSIFLGNSNGTLRAATAVNAGAGPAVLASGDFNHDGKMDLAVLNQIAATVSVYLGRGDGTFTHNADYNGGPNQNGGFSPGMVAADFNHDGLLDLAVANGTSPEAFVFLGKADGSFVSGSTISLPAGAIVGPIAAADFNQDGNLDLLVQGQSCDRGGCFGPVLIFGGNGDGTFDQGHNLGTPDSGVPLTVADINGDHVPDVVTAFSVVLVNPAAIFINPPHSQRMAPSGLGVLAIAAGDFDGDGRQDIVTANSEDNTVSLLLGGGDGTFHQPLRYPTDEANSIISGDFNGDGIPDIAIGKEIVVGIQIFFGNGDGTLRPPVEIATDLNVLELAVADFNHDGIPDLVATGLLNSNPILRILPGHGDGTFGPPIDRPAHFQVLRSLAVADFNSDGVPDIATLGGDPVNPGMFLHIYFNNGDGTLRDPVSTSLGFQADGIAAADFNHDGEMDVVVGRNNNFILGNVAVFLGTGDGTFLNTANYTAGPELATGDFNHDGIMDFISEADLFLGNGNGTFRQLKSALHASGSPYIADLNNDGLPDVVFAQTFSLAVAINNGDGTFQGPVVFSTGGAWDAAIGDFDSDGHPDIVTAGGFTNRAISLLLSANAAATPVRDFQLALNPQSFTLTAGQSASGNVTITALGAFTDQITFSCAGLPAHAGCSFTPASGVPANGMLASTLTLTTQAAATARLFSGVNGTLTLGLALPFFGLILAGKAREKRKMLVILAPLMACALFMAGCGSVSSKPNGPGGTSGTPQGTFTITVNAVSSGNPAITHSQTLILKVQ